MKSDFIVSEQNKRFLFKRILFQEYEFIIKDYRNNSLDEEFQDGECDNIIDEFMVEYENIPQLETTQLMGTYLKSKILNGRNILDIGSGNQGLCGLLASKCGAANVIFTCYSTLSQQPSSLLPTSNYITATTTTTTTTVSLNETMDEIKELININQTSLSSRVISFHFGLENLNSFFNKISIPFDYIIANNILLKEEFQSIEKLLLLFGTISSMLMIQKYHNPNHSNCKCLFSINSNTINIPIIKILDIANRFNLKNQFINIGNFNDNIKLIEFTLS
ncbi:hypothetical protein ACTA71_008208 [Dictyostelium dimigraforme]